MIAFKSTRWLKELERRRREFSRPIKARIIVPPELRWWYFHEYGTALRGETPYASGHTYEIHPIRADWLQWPDENEPDGFRRQFVVKAHPGVRATHMIRSVLDDIAQLARTDLMSAMLSGGFRADVVRGRLLEQTMHDAKNIIVASIAQHLHGTRPDGKLEGRYAHEVFEQKAEIKPIN
jgi:hypothetical protein